MSEGTTQAGESKVESFEESKHLVFRLGEELYATPLVQIREIIKMQKVKTVPFMASYFKGILNLRGQIVSVVDLRMRFEIPQKMRAEGILVVFETSHGPVAAVVDDVVSVSDFQAKTIEKGLALKSKIPVDFFTGVGHLDKRLVYVVDVGGALANSEFAVVRRQRSREVAAA